MKYDIFISYRREGGYDTAKHLNDLLLRDGYNVSFDIDTLRSGDFDKQLLERIDQCKDFILIVDEHAFDRTLNPEFNPKHDWLRCELAYALKKNKNIIPVFLSGVKAFPTNLPPDISGVTKKNGPEYNRYYFNDFYKTLKERFLHKKINFLKNRGIAIILAIVAIVLVVLVVNNSKNNDDYFENSNTVVDDSIFTETIAENSEELNSSNEASNNDNTPHFTYEDIPINLSISDFSDRLISIGYTLIEKNNSRHYYKFKDKESDEIKAYWIEQLDKVFLVERKCMNLYCSNQEELEQYAYDFQDMAGRECVDIGESTKGYRYEYGFIEFDEEDGYLIMRYYDNANLEKYMEM